MKSLILASDEFLSENINNQHLVLLFSQLSAEGSDCICLKQNAESWKAKMGCKAFFKSWVSLLQLLSVISVKILAGACVHDWAWEHELRERLKGLLVSMMLQLGWKVTGQTQVRGNIFQWGCEAQPVEFKPEGETILSLRSWSHDYPQVWEAPTH